MKVNRRPGMCCEACVCSGPGFIDGNAADAGLRLAQVRVRSLPKRDDARSGTLTGDTNDTAYFCLSWLVRLDDDPLDTYAGLRSETSPY